MTKQVVYFLTEFAGQEIICQPEEVSASYLLPYEQAYDLLTFADTKRILMEAHSFLKQR